MRQLKLIACSYALACVCACTTYEYEEETTFKTDGSGTLRISGSLDIIKSLYGVDNPSSISAVFNNTDFLLDTVKRTSRKGRSFVHIQGSFTDWNSFCSHPNFKNRQCYLKDQAKEWDLHLSTSTSQHPPPKNLPSEAMMAFRFRFPSKVVFHNSEFGIERGNIVRWQKPAHQYFQGSNFLVKAKFKKRSVLVTTAFILGTAITLTISIAIITLGCLTLKGKRLLSKERKRRQPFA